jgi:hypothetical protein
MTSCQRPAHVSQTAAECGSTGSFWGLPAVNHAGTRIAYAQATENGLGIFMNDVATGNSQLISEFMESNTVPSIGEFGVLAWSPDDASFAYTRNLHIYGGDVSEWSQEIVVCDARTGAETVAVSFPGRAKWPTADSFFTWLSADAFAYVNSDQELHLAQNQGGRWVDTLRFAPPPATNDPAPFITATASNGIVWLQGNILWTLASGTPGAELSNSQAASIRGGCCSGAYIGFCLTSCYNQIILPPGTCANNQPTGNWTFCCDNTCKDNVGPCQHQ